MAINFTLLARFGPAPKLPDSAAGWITFITLGIVIPIAALYIGKRIKKRKK